MLSHQDKCLFVHIPKAAGQSVESVFVQRCGLTWQTRDALLLRPNKNPVKGPPRLAHLTANEYVDLGYMSSVEFDQYFKFSFVRNPWARLVSEYNYRRMHGVELYQKEFKRFLFESLPIEGDDDYANSQDFYRHIIPQWKFLYDENGKCLVDFVGKFESLQQDFDKVCQQLGIPQTTLPHKNITKLSAKGVRGLKQKLIDHILRVSPLNFQPSSVKPHYSKYYDDESQAFVAEYYHKDIELFNYQFESN